MSEEQIGEKSSARVFSLSTWFRINPAFYSFVSGIAISVSINLYTGVFSSTDIPSTAPTLLLSALLTFISAIFWTILALELDRLKRLAYTDVGESYEILDKLIVRYKVKLRIYFWIACLMIVIGLVSLPLGHLTNLTITEQEPTEQEPTEQEPTEQEPTEQEPTEQSDELSSLSEDQHVTLTWGH